MHVNKRGWMGMDGDRVFKKSDPAKRILVKEFLFLLYNGF